MAKALWGTQSVDCQFTHSLHELASWGKIFKTTVSFGSSSLRDIFWCPFLETGSNWSLSIWSISIDVHRHSVCLAAESTSFDGPVTGQGVNSLLEMPCTMSHFDLMGIAKVGTDHDGSIVAAITLFVRQLIESYWESQVGMCFRKS